MDVDGQAASVEKSLAELRNIVQASGSKKKGKDNDQMKQISDAERVAQRVKNSIESYKLELRVLPKEEQMIHMGKLREFEEALKQCRTQIDWKRLDVEAANRPSGGDCPSQPDCEGGPMTLEQAVATAEKTQEQSKASLNRSLGMVLQAEQVGISSLEQMHAQEEQLNRIGEDVEDIKANIARSKKLVGQIARSAAGDRCIQMLCVLIAIAIMVMISLAATGHDGGDLNVPDPVRQQGSG
eukprot:TRINITY_DN34104_c0_g1_i1.p1 TRINITY_DN34104_c0_g1~~TRINITY_DN34104_c0_g1_i1.p1  ORF type:complete len:240 (+),score=49.38 TRINITY_DN34104_c0_g1_i1:98-817(+)